MIIPVFADAWFCALTATPFGRIFRRFLTRASKKPVTKTYICQCSFRKACSRKKKTTSKASLRRLHGLPSAAASSFKSVCACVQLPKPCSATTMQKLSNPTATCLSSITSGATSAVGRKPLVPSYAPWNSSGRRVTPCTKPQRRPLRRPSVCSTSMRMSAKRTLPCPW